jgi:hypothetical protein
LPLSQPSGISTAKRGVAEDRFAKYLDLYFPDLRQPNYSFDIPDTTLAYSADFCLQLPCGLSIDVEIDKPYVGNTKEPHHCSDGGKDDRRNQFFIDDNWLVVRFSERQVVVQAGSPALTVISNAYLNNWSEAEVIQISITYR